MSNLPALVHDPASVPASGPAVPPAGPGARVHRLVRRRPVGPTARGPSPRDAAHIVVDEGGSGCERGQIRACQTSGRAGTRPSRLPDRKRLPMPALPTLLVLDADPPPRLGRLTGRARIV